MDRSRKKKSPQKLKKLKKLVAFRFEPRELSYFHKAHKATSHRTFTAFVEAALRRYSKECLAWQG